MASQALPLSKSYRFIDRRGAPRSGGNFLYEGATPSRSQTFTPWLDKDVHSNVSNYGRRMLMTLGRMLFANYPAVGGAIREQAWLASENFQPQFYGEDREYGTLAENTLLEWGNIMSVEGSPYDFQTSLNVWTEAQIRDGDFGILLTENADGYPMIQQIPGHRIGSATCPDRVDGGPYDGAQIIDGAIVDAFRRVLAYRVYGEDTEEFFDVPAQNMIVPFIPDWMDQVRGFSGLATAIFPMHLLKDSTKFEMIAQQAASAISLLEENEAGGFDPTKGTMRTAATYTDSNKTTLAQESLDGGTIRYFKSGANAKLSAFSFDRPGANAQMFRENVLRDAFQGMDWNYFFAVDPSKPGGASMRVIIEKINRQTRRRQAMLRKVCKRIHGYAISKLTNLGLLPESDEWWKWDYQIAAEITADRKYDSDVDLQEYNARMTTLKRACGKRGEYWEDTVTQWMTEQKFIQDEAKRLGVDLEKIAIPETVAEAVQVKSEAQSTSTTETPGGQQNQE